MPAADLGPMTELFSHRFLQILREGKHLSARKVADLLSWKHSGFHIDSGGEKPVAPHDTDGRKRLAEYLLRAPFSQNQCCASHIDHCESLLRAQLLSSPL